MELSNELISQFVKATKDDEKPKTGAIVNGTTVEYNGKTYVKIDGSELLTPVNTTTAIKPGERVTVNIQDHSATVTGNLTYPSARDSDVQSMGNQISEFEIVIADKVSTKELEAESARIDELRAENVSIKGRLDAGEASIGELEADNVVINEKLIANQASIDNLEATKISVEVADAKYATIENLDAANADIYNLNANYATFKTTTTDKLTAVDADIETLRTNKLDATTAEITYANIDFSNIGEAAVKKIFSDSGIIKDLIVSDGKITGELVGVTIKGDLIEGNTIVADKLVIKGTDGLYYKLNTDGVTTETEQTDYNSINGSIITVNSITATKIAVDDLVAFDATIGGFKITADSIYSGVKENVSNTTRGIYMDNTGQLAVGDSNNFIKYYKDTDGTYKLGISANSISMIVGSSKETVATSSEVKDVQTSVNNAQSAADKAQNTADNAKDAANNAQTSADNAQSTANNAQTSANKAQSAADNAQDTADTAQKAADNAQDTADTAQKAADDAQSTADGAQSAANNAQSTAEDAQDAADNAQDAADNAQGTATAAYSAIQQLSDSISMLVTDSDGTSLMTQTSGGWTFNIGSLQQTVTDLSELKDYITIGTYNGEPCIELGEKDNDFKLRITNTKIVYTEGSTELAYFNNQAMYINKAVIEEELQQGKFVWKARSNGNLGLVWRG